MLREWSPCTLKESLMNILETERLVLRKITPDDAGFILALFNDPAFVNKIGDRRVRSLDDAAKYIPEKMAPSYERNGYGLYLVCVKGSGEGAGICGLVKRETLLDADIGFAFLPQYRGQGFALESAAAVLLYAKEQLGLPRVLGVTKPENAISIRILEKIGLKFIGTVRLTEDSPEVNLYFREL